MRVDLLFSNLYRGDYGLYINGKVDFKRVLLFCIYSFLGSLCRYVGMEGLRSVLGCLG